MGAPKKSVVDPLTPQEIEEIKQLKAKGIGWAKISLNYPNWSASSLRRFFLDEYPVQQRQKSFRLLSLGQLSPEQLTQYHELEDKYGSKVAQRYLENISKFVSSK